MVAEQSAVAGVAPVRTFVLVTGNPNKLAEARRIVGPWLEAVDIDLPEIQSLSLEAVIRAKAAEAFRRIGRPVVVEETGLELESMNGFPGPLVKWMLEAVGPEGLARSAAALGSAAAIARCMVMYRDADREVLGEGHDSGRLVLPPRGRSGFGWDPVFESTGSKLTWAEAGDAAKDAGAHRGMAWRDLLARLAIPAAGGGSGH